MNIQLLSDLHLETHPHFAKDLAIGRCTCVGG